MKTKDFRAQIKTEGDGLKEGQFRALVSVFGNEDSVGDVVMPGAFTKSLAEWAESGDAIPVIWAHRWDDPFAHIGKVLEAKETDRGLEVLGELNIEGNATAKQVHSLLKHRNVRQFSFAYDVEDGGWGTKDGREVFELRQLKVHEVGPCLLGANQATELLAAKAASLADGVKAGRVLSQKNYDTLVTARDALNAVIEAAEPEKTSEPVGSEKKTDEKSDDALTLPADDEPTGAKSDVDARSAHRRALAVAIIHNL